MGGHCSGRAIEVGERRVSVSPSECRSYPEKEERAMSYESGNHFTQRSVEDSSLTWDVVLEALRQQPAGLFTDIDGVISSIAPTPDQAWVAPGARDALRQLLTRLRVVAALSGRAPATAAAMVQIPGMLYVGNHGLEELVDGEVTIVPEALPYVGKVAPVLAAAQRQLDIPGLIFEDKGITGTVHFRQAPEPDGARCAVRRVLEPLVDIAGLALSEGRMIFEIRPPVALDKGAAARRLIQRYGLASCVFLGDDVTDTHAFEVLRDLRSDGAMQAVCVGVLSTETPAVVTELSDLTVDGVDGVVELLSWINHNL